ncbi:cytochrome P450 [Ascodesmis nigricans]|uniref:Cytochrome P450 n=1 Tax=Ascodesmis nigricans TaxID=341454 RepID=A0A4S2MS46_9PEZI|nr:cytochrome P450 [Ascodesmis nigricans]
MGILKLSGYTVPELIGGAVVLSVLYALTLAVYRLFFHPLAKIPGAPLSKITYNREVYYAFFRNGRWPQQYSKDHEKYGPIIRLNPDEVHISDPEFYNSIYYMGTKFTKPGFFYGAWGIKSIMTAQSNSVHRFLRAPLEGLFARPSILAMNPMLQEKVDYLVDRATKVSNTSNGKLNIHAVTRAFTVDVIMEMCIGKGLDMLRREDLGKPYLDAVTGKSVLLWVADMYLSRWLKVDAPISRTVRLIPRKWIKKMEPTDIGFFYLYLMGEDEVTRLASLSPEELEKETYGPGKRTNIFKELLKPGIREKRNLSLEYMVDESFFILAAGLETTACTMTKTIYNILRNPDVHEKLFQELKEAFPDINTPMPYAQLDCLPYFSACIKEGLRCGDAVPMRLPRVVPEGGIKYKDYYLPAGTMVSMSAYMQHRDATVFPDPEKFDPSRWLGEEGLQRETYLVALSKGSRSCLGRQLAYAELYMAIAALFRRFEMKLVDVDDKDMVLQHIYIGSFHSNSQRPCKVTLVKRTE